MITRQTDSNRRRLEVAFSPHLPAENCDFQVTSEGVRPAD